MVVWREEIKTLSAIGTLMININKPCIKKCSLNEEDVCLGCFRTFDDMIIWNKANQEEKTKMIKIAEQRKKEHVLKLSASKKSS